MQVAPGQRSTPRSVVVAVRLMWVVSAIVVVQIVVGLATVRPAPAHTASRSGVHHTIPGWVVLLFATAGLAVYACSWLLLAWWCRLRLGWARPAAAVWALIAAAGIINGFRSDLAVVQLVPLIALLPVLVGLVVALYLPSSRRHFTAPISASLTPVRPSPQTRAHPKGRR